LILLDIFLYSTTLPIS